MVDMTKDESRRMEKLKQLWRRFGNLILWVIVIIAAAFAIWTYWQKQKESKLLEASAKYLQLENDLQSGLKSKTIITEAHSLMQSYPDTVYAKFSGLLIANEYVGEKLYQAAETNLNWVISNTNDQAIKAVATLRLARIKIATGQSKEAIDVINQAKLPESYQPLAKLIQAQAYIQLADKKNAESAFNQAKVLLVSDTGTLANPANKLLVKESKDYIDMQLSNINLLIKNANDK
ncbi:tetratricopeptide repeat protein [Thiotrichales bacterium 19S3-7]|nr:tetratricopeptide repeat protein [Thiotrichales bacterium 19S3-7]MCF6801764.1 tetratricopeptide repeat protein [Thiotrichales bacterium 19S3-11]